MFCTSDWVWARRSAGATCGTVRSTAMRTGAISSDSSTPLAASAQTVRAGARLQHSTVSPRLAARSTLAHCSRLRPPTRSASTPANG
ncbi:hypothetical protein D3C78_1602080 [compost metagenome]